jgi:hypothetical protein
MLAAAPAFTSRAPRADATGTDGRATALAIDGLDAPGRGVHARVVTA